MNCRAYFNWNTAEENKLHKAFIEFCLQTGCRLNEFAQLRWKDIDKKMIVFHGAKGGLPTSKQVCKAVY